MIWFSADHHFYHHNIIRSCNRPFPDIEDMNEDIIARHNQVVSPRDTVYFLGDVSFRRDIAGILFSLNGEINLIIGNHDHRSIRKGKYNPGYINVFNTKMVRWENHSFFLSHYAHRVWPSSHYGSFHLYGHSHGNLPGFGRSMDVGVDTNNFYPFSAEDIVNRLSNINPKVVDHHKE